MKIKVLIFFAILPLWINAQLPESKRIVLIGIDGMSNAGFQYAFTPNLDALVSQGLLTLDARISMPYISAPNWATH